MSNQVDDKSNKDADDFAWVEQRRSGNVRIIWYIVGFCLAVMLFSGWSFIRFMEQRTGYGRNPDGTVQQQEL